jgi:hypothetical protein
MLDAEDPLLSLGCDDVAALTLFAVGEEPRVRQGRANHMQAARPRPAALRHADRGPFPKSPAP